MRWDQVCPRCKTGETDLYEKIMPGQKRGKFACIFCGAVFTDNLEGELRPVFLFDITFIQAIEWKEREKAHLELEQLRAQMKAQETRRCGDVT